MKFCPQQQAVINHPAGNPALVLAGAGSGKTATIIERAVSLLNQGVMGENLLMLTFTNKAVQEIRERLVERVNELGIPNGLPEVETYHSFGYDIIKKFRRYYFNGFPTLMTESDINNELGSKLKIYLGKDYQTNVIDFVKEVLDSGGAYYVYNEQLFNFIANIDKKNQFKDYHKIIFETIQVYEEFKRNNNMLDFSDLINLPVGLIMRHKEIFDQIEKKFLEIMVDEAQDTNMGQSTFLRFISKNMQNVVMIGDDDQSIYEWRGARPAIMGEFKRSTNATIYKIENNYRSVAHIVNSATTLVRNNKKRMEKNPVAIRNSNRTHVPYKAYDNMIDMAENIAKEIKSKIENGAHPDEIAILYRTNRIGNFLQLSLIKYKVPFEVRAGSDILTKPENKLITSMMRMSVNPNDVSAFKTLGEFIPGVGKKTIEKAIEASQVNKKSLLEQDLGNKSKQTVNKLNIAFQELKEKGPDYALDYFWEHFSDFFKKIIEKDVSSANKTGKFSGLNDEEKFEKFFKKRENNTKLIFGAIKERLKNIPIDDKESRWKEALSLIIAPPINENAVETNKKPRVTLSTIHAAKGLQWADVYIAGFSEGLMPMYDGMNFKNKNISNIEEERRLAYVAFTRAKNNLTLCHSLYYDIGTGGLSDYANELEPSQFAFEIQEHLELDDFLKKEMNISSSNKCSLK